MDRKTTEDQLQKLFKTLDECAEMTTRLLTWGDITEPERDRLARASNAIGWAYSRVGGESVSRSPVTAGHAKLL